MSTRSLERVVPAVETSDGAGVRLRRSIGSSPGLRADPFLMLDEFGTENPDDYIAGFPSHPHRGFETVTYMLDGHMRHQDHLGNVGDLGPGAVQWMSAGRGVIHSEMPMQTQGRMRGFQLWINLPAREKMKPAAYRDIPATEIPTVALGGGGSVKVIAGRVEIDGETVSGPINAEPGALATDPLYLDLRLGAGERFEHPLPPEHSAFAYVYEGDVAIGGAGHEQTLERSAVGILGPGERFAAHAGPHGARFILLAARPLGEPVVQYGPFVMNTREEIEQALADYRAGTLTG